MEAPHAIGAPATQSRSNPVSGRVSQKREYFKYPLEIIGYFAPEVAKLGGWRPSAESQTSF
ncbi:hypothetical protein SAMN05443248_2050 [Bradyrhizobium erythrophlei]|jgi:hypothetical protein|uniref:Uncharacterized protein n=1 Tax=Bradyrhizobium erythrophlei TaxID=1437360 RepID=A0A1M5L100_9BRAD|nr:hypothetical protein SAMN05443248_2050 [Bradyrhizobium erythrophlei]